MKPCIELGGGLRLGLVEPGDAERIFAALDAYREDMRTFLPFVDTTFDSSDSLKYIDFVERSGEEVFAVETDGVFCGLVGFRDTDLRAGCTEIGYWLIPPFRGRGIMRRSVAALVGRAFENPALNCIRIRCAVENVRSERVARALGFTFAGIQPHGELLAGGWTDLNVWEKNREK